MSDFVIGKMSDFVIGKKEEGAVCAWHTIPDIEMGIISENSESYLVRGKILDLEGLVYKDTIEGDRLKQLIDVGKEQAIQKYIDLIILKNVKDNGIYRAILEAKLSAYELGRETKRQVINKVLQED